MIIIIITILVDVVAFCWRASEIIIIIIIVIVVAVALLPAS